MGVDEAEEEEKEAEEARGGWMRGQSGCRAR